MHEEAPAAPPGEVKWPDLRVRFLAAVVLVPLVVAEAWLGGLWFESLLAAIGLIMAWEWCVMAHRAWRWQFVLHGGAVIAAVFASFPTALLGIAAAWLGSGLALLRAGKFGRAWRWLGVPYIAFPLLSLSILRSDPVLGLQAVLWLFAVVWSADIGAYFAGRLIGGPKLAPSISPNKTWAGLAGAIAGGAIAAFLAAFLAGLPSLAALAALGALMGIVEQAGDLFESGVKRSFGVKDSGRLIPGHGGILDRVDGLAFAAVAALLIGALRGGIDRPATGLLTW